jgi:hypothetical protein
VTSEAKVLANRRNAQRSTGPRAAPAKARVRRNALRHGFAAPVVGDPAVAAEVHRVASGICGGRAEREDQEQVLIIAEAQVTLQRVRQARTKIMERMALLPAAIHPNPQHTAPASAALYLEQLLRLERYERGALARRKRAARLLCSRENGEVVPR